MVGACIHLSFLKCICLSCPGVYPLFVSGYSFHCRNMTFHFPHPFFALVLINCLFLHILMGLVTKLLDQDTLFGYGGFFPLLRMLAPVLLVLVEL